MIDVTRGRPRRARRRAHGTVTVVAIPGAVIEMTPPHWHKQVQLALSAGWPSISTVGEPGNHGAVVTGMHGCGVRVPMAAAVAAATCGLVGVVHMPKGAMFAIGLLSWMVAASAPPAWTGAPWGITVSVLGARPNEHVNAAPAVTWIVTCRV